MPTTPLRRCAEFAAAAWLCIALACCAAHRACEAGGCAGDAEITKALNTRIYDRPQFATADIRVQTIGGVVYLYGLVDTNPERATIESLARGIAGVKRVVNSIEVRNFIR